MPEVLLGLGSNVGDRLANLQLAVERLGHSMDVDAVSSIYETAPMYVSNQPPFYNAALRGRSQLGPLALLRILKQTEEEVGRTLGERFGPREIDVDLIAYGSLAYRFAVSGELRLQVPHPKVVERRFVLEPLADVAPEAILPGLGRVSSLLLRTQDQSDTVHKVDHAVLPLHSER